MRFMRIFEDKKTTDQRIFAAAVLALLLILPVLSNVEGENRPEPGVVHYQVVDLVTPESGLVSGCPEGQAGIETPCFLTGVVDEILMQPDRMTVVVSGLSFHYLLGPRARWEIGQPLGLLMASKLNRVPISIRFENWGGVFYLTQVRL